MKIKELDLHGLGHEYAKKVLTSWLKNNHVPYRIITGNSGAMEKIVREVLNLARQVDSARVRLTRTELDGNSSNQLTQVFVKGGLIGKWSYELPDGRLDNNLFRIDGNGGIFLSNPGSAFYDAKQLYLRAKANDGTGIVLERPYSLWLLKPGESRLSQDLDPSIQPSIAPPLSTPRPNRTH